jgi:uncharacterized protein (TIGR04255 family)
VPNASRYDLVSFERPPVKEVVLSVQFAAETFDLEAFGRFARAVHEDLPERQSHPVLPPMTESFERAVMGPSVEIRLEPQATLPRTWFMSKDGVQVVQLQHDRLTLNWRENDKGVEYPRYSSLRQRYKELFEVLATGLAEAGHEYAANFCEVMYVNPVEVPQASNHPQLADVINRVGPRPESAFLPLAEDAQLIVRWRIPGSEIGNPEERPAGRLYLQASPGIKPPDLTPIYLVNLTAHVIPVEGDIDSAFQALDLAHEWVVLGFKDLTTPEMHRAWGLKEVGR